MSLRKTHPVRVHIYDIKELKQSRKQEKITQFKTEFSTGILNGLEILKCSPSLGINKM